MIEYLAAGKYAQYRARQIPLMELPTYEQLAAQVNGCAQYPEFSHPDRQWHPHIARDGSLLLLLTHDPYRTGRHPLGVAVIGVTEPVDLQALRRGCLSCGARRGRLCVVRRAGRLPYARSAPHPRRHHVDPQPPRQDTRP